MLSLSSDIVKTNGHVSVKSAIVVRLILHPTFYQLMHTLRRKSYTLRIGQREGMMALMFTSSQATSCDVAGVHGRHAVPDDEIPNTPCTAWTARPCPSHLHLATTYIQMLNVAKVSMEIVQRRAVAFMASQEASSSTLCGGLLIALAMHCM
jgi:hypothetical protein